MSEPSKELLLSQGTKATVCFLVREGEVLLGRKKRGFGEGRLLGPGGKFKEGETSEQCAKREVEEEFSIKVGNLNSVGSINFFYYEDGSLVSQQVDFYIVDKWEGEPKEGPEMKPAWYKINDLPTQEMPAANNLFVPLMLKGSTVSGNLVFDKDFGVVSNTLQVSGRK